MKLFFYNIKEDEEEFLDKFSKEYHVEIAFSREYPSMENAELTRGYEGMSIYVSDMSAPVLQKFYDMGVRYIATRSVGYEHFDLKKAKELGLRICTVTYSPDTVANYAIMLMLMCCRKAKYIMESSRVQDFSLTGKRGTEFSEKTVGIIGTGKIGRTVIRHLSGFGCKTIAYSRHEIDEVKQYAEYVDLDTLLRTADIISLHAPSTEETCHLINDEAIKKMKDGVIIINTSRGSLIDSEALARGIESGKIRAAGLDVIEKEFGLYYLNLSTKVLDNRELALLKSYPNVIVTPHTAFYTDESISSMIRYAVSGCCLFKEGKPNPFEVVYRG